MVPMSYNYECEVCRKPYVCKEACIKHEHLCKLENCNNGTIKLTDNDYQYIIKNILRDVSKLKEEVKLLKKDHNTDYKIYKKNFIPEKWLDENMRTLQLSEWLEELNITNEQLHYIDTDYIIGIKKIIPELVDIHCPIKSFDIKARKLFVRRDTGWHEVENKDMDLICNQLQKKIYSVWCEEKEEKNKEDIFYEHTLTGGRHKYDSIKNKIQIAFYNAVQLKLTSLIEYKFTE